MVFKFRNKVKVQYEFDEYGEQKLALIQNLITTLSLAQPIILEHFSQELYCSLRVSVFHDKLIFLVEVVSVGEFR